MTAIDQLWSSVLSNTDTAYKKETTGTSVEGSFKKVLKSALEAPENLNAFFTEASKKYGISEKLLKAVAKAESNFNPSATSSKGAAGVMQLMPATAKSLGVADPYDAKSNIMGGARYLKENLDRYNGDVELTLAAYNAGSNNVSKYGGIPPFKETREYVEKIMGYLGKSEETDYSSYGTDSNSIKSGSYMSDNLLSYGSYGAQDSLSDNNIVNIIKALTGNSSQNTVEDLDSQKSNYLYLIELMKLRMQMASNSISGLYDTTGSSEGSVL